MTWTKNLCKTGKSYSIIIDRPVMQILGWGEKEPMNVEVDTVNKCLIIRACKDMVTNDESICNHRWSQHIIKGNRVLICLQCTEEEIIPRCIECGGYGCDFDDIKRWWSCAESAT